MEVLSFWFSFCGHNPFKVEHWYHYQCKMFFSHFLSPIHFCGEETSTRRMKENILLFVELSYFRLIFGNRSAKFLFFTFNFLSFFWFRLLLVGGKLQTKLSSNSSVQYMFYSYFTSLPYLFVQFSSFFVLLSP